MFFAILMFGEPGAEIMYPDPGFPIYESVIEYHRRQGGADRAARSQGLRLQRRGGAGPDHAEDPPDHHQQPGQPDRRHRAARGDGTSWSTASPATRTWRSCRTRSTARCSTTGASTSACCSYRAAARPGDHAGRLVQDLRHDRLAARLSRSGRRNSPRPRPGSPSTAIPASTRRRSLPASPRSTARRTWSRPWSPPSTSGAGSSSPSSTRFRASAASIRAAPSTPSPTSKARASRRSELQNLAARGGRRRHRRRHRLRRLRRRLYPLLLCQQR